MQSYLLVLVSALDSGAKWLFDSTRYKQMGKPATQIHLTYINQDCPALNPKCRTLALSSVACPEVPEGHYWLTSERSLDPQGQRIFLFHLVREGVKLHSFAHQDRKEARSMVLNYLCGRPRG